MSWIINKSDISLIFWCFFVMLLVTDYQSIVFTLCSVYFISIYVCFSAMHCNRIDLIIRQHVYLLGNVLELNKNPMLCIYFRPFLLIFFRHHLLTHFTIIYLYEVTNNWKVPTISVRKFTLRSHLLSLPESKKHTRVWV